MINLTIRSYEGETDLESISDLLKACEAVDKLNQEPSVSNKLSKIICTFVGDLGLAPLLLCHILHLLIARTLQLQIFPRNWIFYRFEVSCNVG